MAKLNRTYPDAESFLRELGDGLSATGLVLPLQGSVPPVGTPVDLNLRLEDGSPLVVGRSQVTSARPGALAVRFTGLTEASNTSLSYLLARRQAAAPAPAPSAPAGNAAAGNGAAPAGRAADPASLDDTASSVMDLVQETYGRRDPSQLTPGAEVLLPPDAVHGPAASPAPPAAAAPGASTDPAAPASAGSWVEPPGRSSRRESPEPSAAPTAGSVAAPPQRRVRTGVAAAVVLLAVAAVMVHFQFDTLAGLSRNLLASDSAEEPSVLDVLPTTVARSEFAEAGPGGEAEGSGEEAGSAPSPLPGEGADAEATPVVTTGGGDGDFAPLDRIRMITWDEEGDETVVTLWGNGRPLAERTTHMRLESGPRLRELVKLRGIDLPYREPVLDVDTPLVYRIRTGFHPKDPVNELHVVLDLTDPAARVTAVELDDLAIRLRVSRAPRPTPPPETAP